MKEMPSGPPQKRVSAFAGVAGQLLEQGLLSAPPTPGLLAALDGYEILSILGEGGMGIVFSAREARTRQAVAIKMIKPDLAVHPQQVRRFLKEARHQKRLQHPHVVPVLEVSEDEKRPYFVMPLMERGCLARMIRPDASTTEKDILDIAIPLASALAHAHSRGLIHRDLKPENILVDANDRVFLSDFGLARTVFNDSWVDPGSPDPGEGTAPYMSPQLARGEAEDTRCDIYALGAILYEMLSGRPPYEGTSTAQIMEQIRAAPPPPLSRVAPKATPALIRIVEGAMARQHRDRYACMEDMLSDMEQAKTGRLPNGPHRQFRWKPPWRFSKPVAIAAIAAALTWLARLLLPGSEPAGSLDLTLVRSLSPQDIRSWSTAKTGDWDGDGRSDLVVLQDQQLHIFSSEGNVRKALDLKLSNDTEMGLSLLADVDGDGVSEAFIRWTSRTNAYLGAFNALGHAVRSFHWPGTLNVHPTWGTNYTELNALQLSDLDRDGREELLVQVASTWALQPRGLACFDVETGSKEWFFPMAGFVMKVLTGDLDGDGKEEVLVGSNAPANGAKLEDGTDDSQAYLFALSSEGRLLWRRRLADYFGSVRPLGLTHNRGTLPEVLLWVTTDHEHHQANGDPETGSVFRISADGEIESRYEVGMQLMGALMTDLESDGRAEILIGDRTGWLHVLNESLTLRKCVPVVTNNLTWVELRPAAALWTGPNAPRRVVLSSSTLERRSRPTNGSSAADVPVLLYHDNQVILLDDDLMPAKRHMIAKLWSTNPGFRVLAEDAADGHPARLQVLTSKADLYELIKPETQLASKP